MVEPKLTDDERKQLVAMNFTHAVMIAEDVSVVSPGAIEAVFRNHQDAINYARHLDYVYSSKGAFVAIALD